MSNNNNVSDIFAPDNSPDGPLFVEVIRELTLNDMKSIKNTLKMPASVPLYKLRAVHHRQAALIAKGYTLKQVAAITGTSVSGMSDRVNNDPAFIELIENFKDQIISPLLDDATRLQAKLLDLGEAVVDELRERINNPEEIKKIKPDELRKIGEFTMDRTVAPSKSANSQMSSPTTITLNFGGKVTAPKSVIDVTPNQGGGVTESVNIITTNNEK